MNSLSQIRELHGKLSKIKELQSDLHADNLTFPDFRPCPKLKCLYITNYIFGVTGCSLIHKSYPPFISTALSIHKLNIFKSFLQYYYRIA